MYVSDDIFRRGTPAILAQVQKEIIRFAWLCADNFKTSLKAFFERDEDLCRKVIEIEKNINYINHELNVYLVKVYSIELSTKESERVGAMFSVISDFERIGDHAENIAGYTRLMLQEKTVISDIAMQGLSQLGEMTVRNVRMAVEAFRTGSVELQQKVEVLEEEIDQLSAKLVNDHIERLKFVACDPRGGVVYTEIISDLERISDHCTNLAETVPGAVIPEKERGRVDKII
jgi:phosphate:Na+ symporter